MKVTCPQCSTSYRVGDEKVPLGGAQIKCPRCSHQFVVRRPGEPEKQGAGTTVAPGAAAPPPQVQRPPAPPPLSPAPAPSPLDLPPAPAVMKPLTQDKSIPSGAAEAARPGELHEQATPLDALSDSLSKKPTQSGAVAAAFVPASPAPPAPPPAGPAAVDKKSSATPNLDRLSGEAFISLASNAEIKSTEEQLAAPARGVSAIRAQSGKPVLKGREEFKVRTGQGLLYDFPSRDALLRWLADRDDTDTCQVSTGGDQWVGAQAFLAKESTAGSAAQVRVAPPLYSPPAALATAVDAKPRPSVLPLLLWLGWALTTAGVLLVAAATLTRYGVFDFSAYLPLNALGVRAPERERLPPGEIQPPPAVDAGAMYARAMGEAQQALRGKRFSKAALEFNRALAARPGSREALEGLVKAYQGLGDRDRAQAAEKKLRQVLTP